MGGDGELVELRDGSCVRVRKVRADDRPLFVSGFSRLGPESRYRRFLFHKKLLRDDELDFLTQLDHRDHEAIGAIDEATGCGVGVARMVREGDGRSSAEAAVAVVDDWQGRGLGGLLLDRLTARARELGVERFTATLFTDSRSMMALFERLGCVQRRRHGNVVAIEVDLPVERAHGGLRDALRSAASGAVHALPGVPE
jgi:GNAT superfamily N-acetyltransferase